jgi:tetratricopeptide (TPR) repeat protein
MVEDNPVPDTAYPYDVFLCHANEDQPLVETLARRLVEAGLQPWFERWHLVPGEPRQEALANALGASSTVAVCVGSSGAGPWPSARIQAALEARIGSASRRVVPVMLPGANPRAQALPRSLIRLTWVDLGAGLDDEGAVHRLVSGIRGALSARGPSAPHIRSAREAPAPDDLPPPGPLPHGSWLPFSRNALFTGRETALLQLARILLYGGARRALVTQALAGRGGMGKTQLAIEYAWRYGRYYQGVHWLNAAQPGDLPQGIAACGARMGLAPWPEELPAQVAFTLDAWRAGGRRLVVLDNLEDLEAARAWLPRLSGGGVQVLFTARQGRWPRELDLRGLALSAYTPQESLAFLRKYLPDLPGSSSDARKVADADLRALAERLGHLALTEELAGRYLDAHPGLSVDAYLARLAGALDDAAMHAWREGLDNPTEHDLELARALALGWAEVAGQGAQRVLRAAGYCAPNTPLPCALLERAAGLAPDACDVAVDRLVRLGLLQRAAGATDPTVHPLVAEYARTHRAPSDAEALPALASALASLAAEANRSGLPERFAPLRPHVQALLSLPGEQVEALHDAGTLWNELGYHLSIVADYEGARASYQRALEVGARAFGADHPNVATFAHNLGGVQQALGELAAARASYQRALAIDERAFGPDHPKVAIRANNLGAVQQALGELAAARASYQHALEVGARAYGPDHPNVAAIAHNLGGMQQALGELAAARASFQRALEIDERAYGPDHPNVATIVNSLGGVQRDLGELAAARASFQRALQIDERTYGPDHPKVAIRVNNLGAVQQALGQLAAARASFQRALQIDEHAYGPDHPKVAIRVNNLGSVQCALDQPVAARASYQRALAIDERAFGPDHPKVAIRVNNLGRVWQDLGELETARASYQRALAIDERAFGPDHANVARDVNNLGSVQRALGELGAACASYERALNILVCVLPADHPHIQTVLDNLERCEADLDGGEAYLDEA